MAIRLLSKRDRGDLPNKKSGQTNLAFLAVVLGCVVSAGLTTMQLVPQISTQRGKLQSKVNHKLALDSVLSFTKYAIKNHWCMTESWIQDSACSDFAKTFNHPRSFDRLIVNAVAAREIKAGGLLNPFPSPLALDQFSATISREDISRGHPLTSALAVIAPQIKGIKITATRINNVNLASSGGEVFLRLRVEEIIQDENGTEKVSKSVTETIALFPTEVGSFSLIVKGSIYLNGNTGSTNDISFDPVPKANASQYKGIVFQSPVFSNKDLVLPNTIQDIASQKYTPVTFADRVVLGAGTVLKDGKFYDPSTVVANGDTSALLNTYNTDFGGTLAGVTLQTGADRGLDYLFGAAGSTVIKTNMEKCIKFNQITSDPAETKNSIFAISREQFNSSSDLSSKWSLGLTEMNEFQNTDERDPSILPAVIASSGDLITRSAVPIPKPTPSAAQSPSTSSSPEPEAEESLPTAIAPSEIFKKASDFTAGSDTRTRLKVEVEVGNAKVSAYMSSTSRLRIPLNFFTTSDVSKSNAKNFLKNNSGLSYPVIELQAYGIGKGATQIGLEINIKNQKSLQYEPKFKFTACDYGTNGSCGNERKSVRRVVAGVVVRSGNQPGPNDEPDQATGANELNFIRSGSFASLGNITVPNSIGGASGSKSWTNLSGSRLIAAADVPDPLQNIEDDKKACEGGSGTAFGVSANFDYAPGAVTSWNFASPGGNIELNSSNAGTGSSNIDFVVASIAETCTIKASANFVAGFFTCKRLVIERRTTPLEIVGTMIVGSLSVDPSAIMYGIKWSSIYHPNSLYSLRKVRVLRQESNGASCANFPQAPIWDPQSKASKLDELYSCTPFRLRYKADPFTWSEVTPLCGIQCVSGVCKSATTCNLANHPFRLQQVVYSRNYQL